MASNITLSAGVRQNLLALQNTAALLGTTQNRLATGKKVNSALDNPTNFFTSSALSARSSDLSSLLELDVERHQHPEDRRQRHHRDHHGGADPEGDRHPGPSGRLLEEHVVHGRPHHAGHHRRPEHFGRRSRHDAGCGRGDHLAGAWKRRRPTMRTWTSTTPATSPKRSPSRSRPMAALPARSS